MILKIWIHALRRENQFVGKMFERVIHALGGLTGHRQEANAGTVGRFLLSALIGKQPVYSESLRCAYRGNADITHVGTARTRAGGYRTDPEQHADKRGGLDVRQLLANL